MQIFSFLFPLRLESLYETFSGALKLAVWPQKHHCEAVIQICFMLCNERGLGHRLLVILSLGKAGTQL